jgi:hypothetical protein
MSSRFVQWCAALTAGMVLALGSANATTTINMGSGGGPFLLIPDAQYAGGALRSNNGGDPLSGTDVYTFTYAPPPILTATNSTTNLSVNGSGFSTLNLRWIGPGGSGVNQGPLNALAGITNLPLSLTIAGLYTLSIAWARPATGANSGFYTTTVVTPPVPLPPALLLFGSAMVGLGMLARRRRKVAAAL